jgi:RNA polymerase sigma-70 factor (ECF subfamily)
MATDRQPDPPDALLVERARRGDPAAFETLVRRHYRAAYAVALAVLGDGMDAEDACHDGFLQALERLDQLRRPDRFAGWLLQIVRNRARNLRGYLKVRSTIPLDAEIAGADDENDGPAAPVERAELRRELEAALGTLTEVQREVVLLHDMEGWKHREIAEALGLSEGMSRQHLMAARRALRQRLGLEFLEEHSDG